MNHSNKYLLNTQFIFILVILGFFHSCSLKENPEEHLVEVLKINQDFRMNLLQTRPDLEAIEIEYQKVKGHKVPVKGLRWWRGVHRSFYFPKDTLQIQDQGFSLHTLVMYNRREALKLFNSFCQDTHWQMLQIISKQSRIYLYQNAVIHLNLEPGLSQTEIQQLSQWLEEKTQKAKGSKSCICRNTE